jgi:hypothetical protein
VVTANTNILWNLMPCNPVQLRRRFGGVDSTVLRNGGELLLNYAALQSNDLAFLVMYL